MWVGGSLGFYLYIILLVANRGNLTSYFPIWMPLFIYSCLIALARTSSTMLNGSGKSEILVLESMMLVVGLPYVIFIMLKVFFKS